MRMAGATVAKGRPVGSRPDAALEARHALGCGGIRSRQRFLPLSVLGHSVRVRSVRRTPEEPSFCNRRSPVNRRAHRLELEHPQ